VPLSDGDRQALAEIGQKLGRKTLAEIATIAKPDTILAWHRQFATQQCNGSKPHTSVGRPRTAQELEALVVRMARENRSWGYDRIVGALANLGYAISDQTVGNILKRHSIPAAPERKKTVTWREFVCIHMEVLGVTEFFRRELWTWCGVMLSYVLSFVCLDHYKRSIARITSSLHAWWMLPWLQWFLDKLADVGRSGNPGRAQGGVRLLQCDERLQGPPLSTFAPADDRQRSAQGIGTGVRLSAVTSRQIRDGPMRPHQRLGGLLQYHDCEAA
jgi:Homeodomain-like domain